MTAARARLPAAPPPVRSGARLGIALAFLVGAGLCGLGIARSVAAFYQLRASAVVDRLADADPAPGPAELRAAIADFAAADRWWREAANPLDIAILDLAAGDEGQPAGDAAALERIRESLARRPGDATAWAWLADARLRGGARSEAAAALSMSIGLARFEPALLPWRAGIGLAIARDLTAAQWREIADQLRLLGGSSIDSLVAVARAAGKPALVAMALDDDPALQQRFIEAIERAAKDN
jgi:hypothetical protein